MVLCVQFFFLYRRIFKVLEMSLRCLGGNINSTPPTTAGVWGLDQMLQLQAGSVPSVPVPPPVAPSGGTALGTLWAWGANTLGQCGNGTTSATPIAPGSPVQIGAVKEWMVCTAAGTSSYAIKGNGTLWSWGDGTGGRLGLGDTNPRTVPTQVGALTTWSKVRSRFGILLALKTDGTLWSWGSNTYGGLGLGPGTVGSSVLSPTQVGTDTDWADMCSGSGYSIAIKTNGTIWSCGLNSLGQLGQGDTTDRNVFTQIGSATDWLNPDSPIDQLGAAHVVICKKDHSVWVWGSNSDGQLGGVAQSIFLPLANPGAYATSPVKWNAFVGFGGAYYSGPVACGTAHTLVGIDGGVWWGACGDGTYGQFGLGSTVRFPFVTALRATVTNAVLNTVTGTAGVNNVSTPAVYAGGNSTALLATAVTPIVVYMSPGGVLTMIPSAVVYTGGLWQFGEINSLPSTVPNMATTKTWLRASVSGAPRLEHFLGIAA